MKNIKRLTRRLIIRIKLWERENKKIHQETNLGIFFGK
jgi:hypothetical protein